MVLAVLAAALPPSCTVLIARFICMTSGVAVCSNSSQLHVGMYARAS